MLWGENRSKWNSWQSLGVEPKTSLAWATSALPLSHDSQKTTNLNNHLCVLHRWYWVAQSHTWQPLPIVHTIHFCHNYLSTVYTASWQFLLLRIYAESGKECWGDVVLGSRSAQHERKNKVPGITEKRAKLARYVTAIVPDFTLGMSMCW